MPPEFTQLQLALLGHLRQRPGSYHEVSTLAQLCAQSSKSVSEALDALGAWGYQLSRNQSGQVSLTDTPDRLYAHEIRFGLPTRTVGSNVHAFDITDSTNLRADEFARQNAPEGTLVVCEMQSAGKGRLNRQWYSPRHTGIYASLVLRPKVDPASTPGISLLMAAAVVTAVRELTDLPAQIKWPNDVLIGGRKSAGILADLTAESARVSYLILGLGVNVNQSESDFPPEIAEKATSIRLETGRPLNRVRLLQHILMDFEKRYFNFLANGLVAELPTLKALSSVLSKRIRFEHQGARMEGTAMDIDANGLLVVDVDGRIMNLTAGEISLAEAYQ
jgi:BirA family biotin operon repressor/biotin-[acetyl-CoA-carboxylase] ligase